MAEIIKYYSNYLNNLNKKYDEYTKNYIRYFVEFKIPVFSCSLTRNDLNSVDCINNFSNNNAFVSTQKKIEDLNQEYLNITLDIILLIVHISILIDLCSNGFTLHSPFFFYIILTYSRLLIFLVSSIIIK